MKRKTTFLLTAFLLLMAGLTWGQTRNQINWVAAEQGYDNAQPIESIVFDSNVSAVFDKGTNNNGPKYYNTGQAIRCYAGNYFTISTNGSLTEIELTFGVGDGTNEISTDVGTCSDGIWTGSASSVTFSIGGTTGHRRITGFNIAYTPNGMPTVNTPTFSPVGGTYTDPVDVTISCSTSGATIFYTLDGTTPTSSSAVYTSPINVSTTTTIKAMGVLSGMNNSSVATATYSFLEVMTIAEARALADNEYAMIQGVVTLMDGRNIYIQDATAGIDLFLNSNTVPESLALGDMVLVYGKKTVYHGLVELTGINGNNPSEFSIVSSGNELPLVVLSIEEILADVAGPNTLQSTRLQINDATVGAINYSGNTPISQGANTLNIYKLPEVPGLQEGDNITVVGVLGYFDAPQLRVNSADDVTISAPQDMVAAPTFNPPAGAYTTAQSVTISCATEGATIYYTLDGTLPTPNSAVYTQPIEVNTSMTIMAIGVKSGLMDSYIASATYSIVNPTPIIEARTLAINEYALVQGVVTLLDGRTIYIQDATAGIALYLNANTVPESLALGDMVLAYGKRADFHSLVELSGINGNNESEFSILSSGNTLPLVVTTIAEILADHQQGDLLQSTRIQVVDAVVGEINTTGDTPIYQDGNSINIYKIPEVQGMVEGDIVTAIAVIGCFDAAQLRVNSAEDIQFTHPGVDDPYISVTPQSLSNFEYVAGAGPSNEQSFTIVGANLTEDVTLTMNGDAFEMSLADLPEFSPQASITLTPSEGSINQTVSVRLKADLTVNSYSGSIEVTSQLDPVVVNLSGAVSGQNETWNRIFSVGELTDGCQVIIAARYDASVANGYYAMPAQVTDKPIGVLFQSVFEDNTEMLPSAIADDASTYLWNVTVANNGYVTLTNSEGASLGYSSSTNFSGNENTEWILNHETSSEGAMVPNYTGFQFTNAGVNVRGIALNSSYKFGAYALSNMNNSTYNFILDLFVLGSNVSQTVANPVFDMPSGTYYNEIDVTISCATQGATIYYTTNGQEPTTSSMVYTAPIHVANNMIIKAVAMKEGLNNSETVSATYIIASEMEVILNQDWEGEMNGWTFVTVQGNKPWFIGQYNNNHYANANGYNDDDDNEQWCISPVFDLTEYAGQDLKLTFKNATKFEGPALQLLFSNDYNGEDPTNATWQSLSFTPSPGNYTWTESGEIDMSGFSGSSCYIAFKYISHVPNDAASWEVDDIMLYVGGAVSNPMLTASPTSANMTYDLNQGPSQAQTYTLEGSNLLGSGFIMVLAPYYFEISLDGTNWDTELGVPFADGILTNQPVTMYVRLAAGLGVGTYSGLIEHEGGGAYVEVSVMGEVTNEVGVADGQALNTVVWNYGNEISVENADAEPVWMTVFNIMGQPVLHNRVEGESSVRFTHGLADGLYIVELQNSHGRSVTKIVVR